MSYTRTQEEAFYSDALAENYRQVEKWGVRQNQSREKWLAILVEEVGEVAKALLEEDDNDHLFEELTQVAAVAAAFAVRLPRD